MALSEAEKALLAGRIEAAVRYADAVVAELARLGRPSAVLRNGPNGEPTIRVGPDCTFLAWFDYCTYEPKKPLRVVWDTERRRNNRVAGENVAAVAKALAADEAEDRGLREFQAARRERVKAAAAAIEALREKYGLVDGEGLLQIVETDYRSGRYRVEFQTGTPEATAEVLAALDRAGIIPCLHAARALQEHGNVAPG